MISLNTYKLMENYFGYNLYTWRNMHDPEYLFDVYGRKYQIYVGVWRDLKTYDPYFVMSKERFDDNCKIARIDFRTGNILTNRNIFRRLKLTDEDIATIYNILNDKGMYGSTIWNEIKYYWNDSAYDHLDYIDYDKYMNGEYDERKRKNKWFISSDTPIPNIHYKK